MGFMMEISWLQQTSQMIVDAVTSAPDAGKST